MTTTSQAAPKTGVKHPDQARIRRGLRLFRERGHEIIEVEPGVFRAPSSTDGATYTVVLDRGYCSCPDRAEVCKHQVACTIVAAKKNAPCRRRRTATERAGRRHGSPGADRAGDGRGSGPARRGGIASGQSWGYGVGRETMLAGLGRMEG